MPIAYLKHPVSAETKAEYRGKGFQIIDIVHKPEKPGKGDFVEGEEVKEDKPKKRASKAKEE